MPILSRSSLLRTPKPAHKGMTVERAREIVTDISYFGTMMVHLGLADGMVSGAVNTTAHTIRPALEFVKTKPGVSTVSSVFFMCLADRVLAYGDCAVIPEPTTEQLADIAISSVETAQQFGIEPRVAMLSYSTGTSGSGAEVEKVRAATALVRERARPAGGSDPVRRGDRSGGGTDQAAGLTGCRGATVFIFPDLNTGNNTYKAVQRSAHAIAIGPVLQGLRKPVNDLSRGLWYPTSSTPWRSPRCRRKRSSSRSQRRRQRQGRPYDRSACAGFERRLLVAEVSTGGARNCRSASKGLIERIGNRVALSLIMTRLCGRCKISLRLRALILKPWVCGLSVIG